MASGLGFLKTRWIIICEVYKQPERSDIIIGMLRLLYYDERAKKLLDYPIPLSLKV